MAGLLIVRPDGSHPAVYFRLQPGSMDQDDFVALLQDVRKELGRRKLLLIWDGLPAHRGSAVTRYITSQQSWLRVERYPAYAPELSPVEFLWSPIKTKHLAHIPPKGLQHLKRLVRKSFRSIKNNTSLLRGCLRKAGVLS